MQQLEYYENIAKNSKNHHWVPEFYLKNFSIPGDDGFVFFYRKGEQSLRINVGNVATKNNLYTFRKDMGGATRAMEGIFSEHEGKTAPILNRIIQEELLPVDDESRSELAVFVSMLRVRGPSFSEWLRNMEAEHIKLFQQIQAEHPESLRENFEKAGISFSSDAEFEETRNFMLNPKNYNVEMEGGEEHYFKQAMELSKELYKILMTEKSWHLLVAPDKRHFVTSDNPVVIQELEDCPPHLAGGFLNGTVLLTISPKHCLAFRRAPLNNQKILLSREDVNNINKSIARSARRHLYSHLDSKDLMTLCNELLVGDESRVTIKRLARFAPYYMSQGIHQDKETGGLKENSVRFY
ncbi:MAG: DUF4238 domain-containing protein [Patescibacteria group bacterium]